MSGELFPRITHRGDWRRSRVVRYPNWERSIGTCFVGLDLKHYRSSLRTTERIDDIKLGHSNIAKVTVMYVHFDCCHCARVSVVRHLFCRPMKRVKMARRPLFSEEARTDGGAALRQSRRSTGGEGEGTGTQDLGATLRRAPSSMRSGTLAAYDPVVLKNHFGNSLADFRIVDPSDETSADIVVGLTRMEDVDVATSLDPATESLGLTMYPSASAALTTVPTLVPAEQPSRALVESQNASVQQLPNAPSAPSAPSVPTDLPPPLSLGRTQGPPTTAASLSRNQSLGSTPSRVPSMQSVPSARSGAMYETQPIDFEPQSVANDIANGGARVGGSTNRPSGGTKYEFVMERLPYSEGNVASLVSNDVERSPGVVIRIHGLATEDLRWTPIAPAPEAPMVGGSLTNKLARLATAKDGTFKTFVSRVTGTVVVPNQPGGQQPPMDDIAKRVACDIVYTPRGQLYTNWFQRDGRDKEPELAGNNRATLVNNIQVNWGTFGAARAEPQFILDGDNMWTPDRDNLDFYDVTDGSKEYRQTHGKGIFGQPFMKLSGPNTAPADFKFGVKDSTQIERHARFFRRTEPADEERMTKANGLDSSASSTITSRISRA